MIDLQKAQRNAPLRTYILGMAATVLISAVAGGVAAYALEAGGMAVGVAAVAMAVTVAGGTAICLAWWRGLDEAAREAHKWAWWWGGTAGTAVAGLVLLGLILTSGPDGALAGPLADLSPIDAVRMMVVAAFLCQIAGYGIAWVVWWLARR